MKLFLIFVNEPRTRGISSQKNSLFRELRVCGWTLISLYLFFLSFTETSEFVSYFYTAFCLLTFSIALFQDQVLISKKSIVFENKGIQFIYHVRQLNKFIDYQDIDGYFIKERLFKYKLVGYSIVMITKNSKHFVIDQRINTIESFKQGLSKSGLRQIPKKISKPNLMFISVFLVIILPFIFFAFAVNQNPESETARNKSEIVILKGTLDKVENRLHANGKEEGMNIKFKEYPEQEFHIDIDYVIYNKLDTEFGLKYDSTTYFFQISKKSYDRRFVKNVKPNFFQKYFNDRIEIYGMRSYQKTYFEVFK